MPQLPPVTSAIFPSSLPMCFSFVVMCSLYLLFPRDPLADIEWAVEERSAFLLTPAQEADHVHVYQRHVVQIQPRSRSAALHLFFHCLKVLRLKLATQPKSRCLPVRSLFNS